MYLKRKIDAYLAGWKADPERKPLIVKGARQIGKTESIRRFSEKRYKRNRSIRRSPRKAMMWRVS